jgi:hypothetical protein
MRIKMMQVCLSGALCLALLCGGSEVTPMAHAASVDGAPVVSEFGKGEKRSLSLALTVGAKGHVSLVHTGSLTGEPGGDVKDRTMKTGITWTILSGDAQQGWRFRLLVDVHGSNPGEGVTASRTLQGGVTPDGAMTLDTPPTKNPGGGFAMMVVSEFAKSAVRLPREPVGVGAMWKTVQHTTVRGIKSVNVTRYALTRLTQGGFEATVKNLVGTGGGGTRAKGESSSVLHWKAVGLYPASLVTDATTTTYARPGAQSENVIMDIHTELNATEGR